MAKFQSPLLGYNNNVRHKGRVFHIQTEDSGVNHPHIITHLFMDGGRILKSVKKSYAEHVGSDGMSEVVRGLMKEQHKAMFIALRDGQFDQLAFGASAPAAAPAPAAVAPPPPPLPPAKDPPALVPPPPTSNPEMPVDSAPKTVETPQETRPSFASLPPPAPPEVTPASVTEPKGTPFTQPPPSPGRLALAEEDDEDESAEAEPKTTRQPEPNYEPPSREREREIELGVEAPLAASASDQDSSLGSASLVHQDSSLGSASLVTASLVHQDSSLGSASLVDHEEERPRSAPPKSIPSERHPAMPPPSAQELTLDFDALERAHEGAGSSSLFQSNDLPPPPKNLFNKEPGTGGAYRTIETGRSTPPDPRAPRQDPRADGPPASERAPASRRQVPTRVPPQPSVRQTQSPQRPSRLPERVENRYAPARPAAIFGAAAKQTSQSIFSDELVSDKSLDEVILSYLAEDLEPPRRK